MKTPVPEMQDARLRGSQPRCATPWLTASVAAIALLAVALIAARAQAEPPTWLLEGTLEVALPLAAPQSDLFSLGGGGSLAVHRSFAGWFGVGGRLRGVFLPSGEDTVVDGVALSAEGMGTLGALLASARADTGVGLVDSPYLPALDLGVGPGLSGDAFGLAFEVGLAWQIPLGGWVLGPSVRYLHMADFGDGVQHADAQMLLAGVLVGWGFGNSASGADADDDGVDDGIDHCPKVAEDKDGYQDHDGCPENDNDGDGIKDAKDRCPNRAEDNDGFEDHDGCPDPDNDADGIIDGDDACPLKAEVVNGVKDEDGCPDKGLIVFVEDRVVLSERVLFDFRKARVKKEAMPALQAVVDLWKQHPEWKGLTVEGHTDRRGSARFNRGLSRKRANNVRLALVKLGMPADKIEAIGHAADYPRDPGTTEAAHERNRRVEFVVTSKKAKRQGSGEGR